jgi:hypothetical protein
MTRFALVLSFLSLLPAGALAQDHRGYGDDRRDFAEDRRDLRNERREFADDRRDLERMEALLGQIDRARATRDRRQIAAFDDAMADELRRERRETRREARQDAREVRAADDRQEYRDERRDLAVERRTAARRDAIARELGSLRGRYATRQVDRRRVLTAELVQLARAEIRQDVREIREDRREVREDRRATTRF